MTENNKLRIRDTFSSVAAAFFGVQSSRNRERDFKQGRARDFIIVGVLATVLFVLAVWGVVKLVMHLALSGSGT